MRTLRLIAPVLFVTGLLTQAALAAAPTKTEIHRGPFTTQGASNLENAALQILRSASPRAKAVTLRHVDSTRKVSQRRSVRFEQMHQGVPVIFRGAGVVLDDQGRADFAVTRLEDDLPAVSPTLTATAVSAKVATWSGLVVQSSDARLAIYPLASGPRLSWIVYPTDRLPGVPYAPVYVVDAHSGERLVSWNAARFAKGRVYPENPVATSTVQDLDLDLAPGALNLTSERVKAFNCVDNQAVKQINIGITLNVHVCDLEQLAAPDSSGDFLYDPPAQDLTPEDPFSEVQIFFHTSKAYAYFSGLGMTDLATKPLPAVANLMLPAGFDTQNLAQMADPNIPFVPFSNAFFAPANPIFSTIFGLPGAAMWFGQGPKADYSYDGDVVYHEFGHAVVDHTLKLVGSYHADKQGLVSSPGAMNEGLADYFAAAITGGSAMGEYAATDLAPGLKSIRDLANSETCPANLSGEVHADSKFWTGALWKVRETLAAADRDKMDKAVFDVMAASPGGDLGFEDLTNLIITSVKSAVSTSAADALTKEMTDRGVLPTCERVIEFKGQPINGGSPELGGTIWAPGKQDSAIAGAPYAPGVLQFKVAIPAATELSVSFSEVKTGGGGTSIFGGGSPFTPSVVVRFGDAPIEFAYSPGFEATADVTLEAPINGGKGVATVAVPAGAQNAYVMVVNTGDQSGGYRGVNFAFSGQPPAPDAGPVDAGADGGAPPKSAEPADDEGCGCRTVGGRSGGAWWLGAALLGVVALRRRRNQH